MSTRLLLKQDSFPFGTLVGFNQAEFKGAGSESFSECTTTHYR
jgi:hypothetical protein